MLEIFRALLTTSLGTLTSLGLGAIALKIIALQSGPAGLGLFSLLRQLQQTVTVVGSWGGQTGYLQAFSREDYPYATRLRTLGWLAICGASLSFAGMLISAPLLGPYLLKQITLPALQIVLTAVAAVGGIAMFFFLALLSSQKHHRFLAMVQVASAATLVAAIAVSTLLPDGMRAYAYAAALSLSLTIGSLFAAWMARSAGLLAAIQSGASVVFSKALAAGFARIGFAALVSAALTSISGLAIRSVLVRAGGLAMAGLFDSAWTISIMYVLTLLSSLSNVYLPRLAACTNDEEQQTLLQIVLGLVLAGFVPIVCLMISGRDLVLHILYTPEFSPAGDLMRLMLMGDFLKVCGFVFAMPLLARGQTKSFISSEALWHVTFWLLVLVFSAGQTVAPHDMALAYLLAYFVYAIFVAGILPARRASKTRHLRLLGLVTLSAIPVLLVSWYNWDIQGTPVYLRMIFSTCLGLLCSGAILLYTRRSRHESRNA